MNDTDKLAASMKGFKAVVGKVGKRVKELITGSKATRLGKDAKRTVEKAKKFSPIQGTGSAKSKKLYKDMGSFLGRDAKAERIKSVATQVGAAGAAGAVAYKGSKKD